MNKDLIWKCVPIAAAVVLVLGVVGMLVFSGKDVSVEGIIALIVAAAGALGLAAPALRNGGSGSTGGAALGGGLVLLVASALLSGCISNPCLAERSTVAALGVAVEMADAAIPGDADRRDEVVDAARAAVQMGSVAVDGCETLRDGGDWRSWLSIGVAAIKAVIDLVRAHGVSLPPDVAALFEQIEAELQG